MSHKSFGLLEAMSEKTFDTLIARISILSLVLTLLHKQRP